MPELIRSTAKAVIVKDGKVLLNRCKNYRGEYFSLPGGGQHFREPLTDAVVRECLEETGLCVRPERLIAVCEEIHSDPELCAKYPEYVHRMMHIFLCTIESDEQVKPTEFDLGQLGSVWVPMEQLDELEVEPKPLCGRFTAVLGGAAPVWLGSALL